MLNTSEDIKKQISKLLNKFELLNIAIISEVVEELFLLVNKQQNQVIKEVLRQQKRAI